MKFLCYLCRCYGLYENISGGLINWVFQDLMGGVIENYQVYENFCFIQCFLDVFMINVFFVGIYIFVRIFILKCGYSEYVYNNYVLYFEMVYISIYELY